MSFIISVFNIIFFKATMYRSACVVCLSAILVSCTTVKTSPSDSNTFRRIETREQFLKDVIYRGIMLKGEKAAQSVFSDGTVRGITGGEKTIGTWTWENKFLCREATIGAQEIERDCIVVEISKSKLRMTYDRGRGNIFLFDLF